MFPIIDIDKRTKAKNVTILIASYTHIIRNGVQSQALVSLKKYMPPPLPYFKVNICLLPLPHFASIFVAYL
jgi:hypothetical protein